MLLSEEHFPVNIGNPSEITILQLAETINSIVGNEAGVVFKEKMRLGDDPQRRQPEISKAKEILNWSPEIDLEEGLKRTLPYFKSRMGIS